MGYDCRNVIDGDILQPGGNDPDGIAGEPRPVSVWRQVVALPARVKRKTAARNRRGVCLAAALVCALLGLGLQFAIVHRQFGGNWTALFCSGSRFPVPPELAGEGVYVFPKSNGYDGQMYHYIAHDPLLRTGIPRYLDNSRVRYRRILLPAAGFLLAAGRPQWIDRGLFAANLLLLFLGAWWLGRYLDALGLHAGFAVLLLLTPASLVSLDRLTADLAITAVCIGYALCVRLRYDAGAYALLVLACLAKETGFVLALAACLALLWERRFWKAAVWSGAMLPAALWYGYGILRTPDYPDPTFTRMIPLQGILEAVVHPTVYPAGAAVGAALGWLDRLALPGFLIAAALSFWLIRRNGPGRLELALALWSLLGLCLPGNFWADPFSGPRVFTPLFVCLLLCGKPVAGWPAALPLLLTVPRIALQVLGPLLLSFGTTQP